MIRFIEVVNQTNFNPRMERTATPKFTLGEIWINEKYVVSVREATAYKSLLKEGLLPPDLEGAHTFTSIETQKGSLKEIHVVVGTPMAIAKRLNEDTKGLLKG